MGGIPRQYPRGCYPHRGADPWRGAEPRQGLHGTGSNGRAEPSGGLHLVCGCIGEDPILGRNLERPGVALEIIEP